jgi:hypothetical protein
MGLGLHRLIRMVIDMASKVGGFFLLLPLFRLTNHSKIT